MSCKRVDQKIVIGIALVVYLIMAVLYVGRVYPFDILPDEFGYWQNVALIRGLDWKQVSALGDYYSYGYSFILLPIHLLADSSLAAYRIAVLLNLIMLLISGIVLMKTTDANPCFCLIYPPLVYYALTTMSEAFLFMIFTLALLVLKRYLRSRNTTDGALLIVLLVFLFTIHMRTLPLLVVALLLLRDKDGEDKSGKKRFIGLFILALILFVLALYAGLIFQKPIIAANGSARTGFYAVLKRFGRLYSLNGLKRFLLAVIGEVFYIGAASLGLGYIGLIRVIRKVREKQDFEYFYLVSFICEMALSALFLYMSESSLSVIYGRYIDFMVPGLMLYGVCEVKEKGLEKRHFLILMVTLAIAAILVISGLITYGRAESLFALGINYFLVEETSPVVMIAIACLSCCVGLVGMLVAGALRERREKVTIIFGVFSAIFIAFAFYIGGDMVNSNMSYSKENVELADRLKDTGDDKIFYIYSEDQPAVQILQFMIPEKPINVVKTVDEITGYDIMSDNYIVVPAYDIINNQLSDKYELYDETRTFKVWK
ncbi:hypothetical protein [Butyrivibrio sp. XPD2006]|uniref:hypothetical protein n=1 Tax=Butyrivibrio sp. XPD2006 TaxID=1280668 RepID=UPI0003B33633|nr:hypothetical protein [Butyrivibrio sp. XPD2006]